MTTQAEILAIMRLLGSTFNSHDPIAFASLFAENATFITPSQTVEGRQAIAEMIRGNFQAFPDTQSELNSLLLPRPGVAVAEVTFRGTHLGPLQGPGQEIPPTGRPVVVRHLHVASFNAAGLIQRYESQTDSMDLMEQLGLAPVTLAESDIRGVLDRYAGAYNRGDAEAAAALCTEDCLLSAPGLPERRGRQAVRDWMQEARTGFPDSRVTVTDVMIQGNLAIVSWTASGTHKGQSGPVAPTGRTVAYNARTVVEIGSGGLIAAQRVYYDRADLLRQLGAL